MTLKQTHKKWLAAGVILIFSCLLMGSVAFWNPLGKAQLNFSNWLYYEHNTKTPIVIVSIGNSSLDENSGLGRNALWPRSYYAQVIENIKKYHPQVIGLDVFFKGKSNGIPGNSLEEILKNQENLKENIGKYAADKIHPEDQKLLDSLTGSQFTIINSGIALGETMTKLNLSSINLEKPALNPYEKLISNAVAIGHNYFLRDDNGVVRTLAPYFKYKDQNYLAFAVQTAASFLDLGSFKSAKYEKNQIELDFENRSLIIPLEDYQMLINFNKKAPATDLQNQDQQNIITVPFIDVYKENYGQNFNPDIFKDKIVLIGAWSRSLNDTYSTPISTIDQMPGVMIHAQAIQTILDQDWLRNMSPLEEAVAIVLMAALALWAIFGLKMRWALPLIAAVGLVYALVIAPLAFRQLGLIVNLIYPPLTLVLAAILGYAYRYFTEFKQKTSVANVLGKYVNTGVAEKVLESGEKAAEVGGEKRRITVIFTDIRSFTSISEKLQPQSLVTLLNEYFAVMAQIIIRNGGTIDKFEGDAIMALFGAVGNQPNHARQAAQAALEMRAALPILIEKWRKDPPLPGGEPKPYENFDFRVGVSTGEAIVGNIGADGKIEFTAIGDIVNLGSRLEGANKVYGTNVMISEETFEQIKDSFECRFMDVIRVKGKEKPIKIYQLLCAHGELKKDQIELLEKYNTGVQLYFESKFVDALKIFQDEILKRWPDDHLADIYAGRCELLKRYPPSSSWDFVYTMKSK